MGAIRSFNRSHFSCPFVKVGNEIEIKIGTNWKMEQIPFSCPVVKLEINLIHTAINNK